MYIIFYQSLSGGKPEYWTNNGRTTGQYWSWKKRDAALYLTEEDARKSVGDVVPGYLTRPEVRTEFIHPLNLQYMV